MWATPFNLFRADSICLGKEGTGMLAGQWLIIGLGNPGAKYQNNRHNLGHMVILELARRLGQPLKSHRAKGLLATGRLGIKPGGVPGNPVTIGIVNSYMNTSGGPVKQICQYYGVDYQQQLLIIHDELDLPEFAVKLKRGGGEGGHNGLRSISAALGGKDYARLRIGIGRPPAGWDVADYVLSNLPKADSAHWQQVIEKAANCVEELVNTDFLSAQQRLHAGNI